MKTKADNDNFEPFLSIGLAAALIVNRLRNQKLMNEVGDAEDGTDRDQKDAAQEFQSVAREVVDVRRRVV